MNSTQLTPENLVNYDALSYAISAMAEQIYPSEAIIIGSLGRRLAVYSDFVSDNHSLESILEDEAADSSPLAPRLGEKGLYDVDIIIPENTLRWDELAEICKSISLRSGRVEIDPHLGDFSNGVLVHNPYDGNKYPTTTIMGHRIPVGLNNLNTRIFVPDLPTQLAFMLNRQRVRKKDIDEILYFYRFMNIHSDRYEGHPNLKVTQDLLQNYLYSKNLGKDLIRLVYHQSIPQRFRERISLRKRLKSNEAVDIHTGFESTDPIYV